MNAKRLLILGGVLLFAVLVFVGVQHSDREVTERASSRLFADVEGEKIGRITVQQGEPSVELALENGGWVLPARMNYPADAGKVRSLLLKVLDLSVSQVVTSNPDKHDPLGVNDEQVKKGKLKITLRDQGGTELGALYVGDLRRGQANPDVGSLGGQYVRRGGRDQVYLIAQPISSYGSGIESWVETSAVNVLPVRVHSLDQLKVTDKGEEPEFRLRRASGMVGAFVADPPAGAGEESDASAVTQASSGLENMRISDVMKADDERSKSLVFDRKSAYRLNDGLVYTVLTAEGMAAEKDKQTAEKDKHIYAKVMVSFDPELAKVLTEEAAAEKKASDKVAEIAKAAAQPGADATEPAAAEPTPGGGDAVATKPAGDTKSDGGKAEERPLKLATAEEAAKLNDQHASWIYDLHPSTSKKFRYTRTELVKPAKPAETAAAPAAPSAQPPKP